jgi:hypothetical protein
MKDASLILVFGLVFPVLTAHFAVPALISAIRLGKLPARGATYNKDEHPLRFWGFSVFWVLMLAMSLLTSFIVLFYS